MVHQQPPAPVATYNTVENNTVSGTLKQRIPIAIDMIIIGSETEYNKMVSAYSGKRKGKSWCIMSQDTIQYGIIEQ